MMSSSHQPVLLTVFDGSSPRECSPWDGFVLGEIGESVFRLNPAVPVRFQDFDTHRFRIMWDGAAELEEREGEGWRRVVGAIIDGVFAEAADMGEEFKTRLRYICDSVSTRPDIPDHLSVGFYVYIMVSDPQTQYQAEFEEEIRDLLKSQFESVTPPIHDLQPVSDGGSLMKALEEGVKQMARHYRRSRKVATICRHASSTQQS